MLVILHEAEDFCPQTIIYIVQQSIKATILGFKRLSSNLDTELRTIDDNSPEWE